MDYLFKWKVGDVVLIPGREKTNYFIIYGTTKFDENRKKYPSYLAKNFGFKTRNGKFTGYHTKAFQQKAKRIFEDEKWFEGMEYLWDVKKVNNLTDIMKKAYDAALSDINWQQDNYNRSQIKYIFNKK